MFEIAKRYIVGASLLLSIWYMPWSSLAAQGVSPTRVMNAIKGFRAVGLADTTPINYCGSDLFWTNAGELVDDGMRLPPARVRNRDECPSTDNQSEYVRINAVSIFADSVVVEGGTRHGGAGRLEIYVFSRSGERLLFREFRILRIYNYQLIRNTPLFWNLRQSDVPAGGGRIILRVAGEAANSLARDFQAARSASAFAAWECSSGGRCR